MIISFSVNSRDRDLLQSAQIVIFSNRNFITHCTIKLKIIQYTHNSVKGHDFHCQVTGGLMVVLRTTPSGTEGSLMTARAGRIAWRCSEGTRVSGMTSAASSASRLSVKWPKVFSS